MARRTKTSYYKSRAVVLLRLAIFKYQPICPMCQMYFTEEDIPTKGLDNITEHHEDGDHYNNVLSNREFVHRTCHKRYHSKDNILKRYNAKTMTVRQHKDYHNGKVM